MSKYDWSVPDARDIESIAHTRSLEEARRAFALPASLPESATLSAAMAELAVLGASTVTAGFFNVLSFANPGVVINTGLVDAREAIQAAIDAAMAAGGGTIYFPAGTYLLPTAGGSVSLPVPAAGANFTTVSQSLQYHFYIVDPTGLRFVGDGVTIRSTLTGGGEVFLFNGARDIEVSGITVQSITTLDGSGNVIVGGMNAFAFTSTTRDSERIVLRNVKTVDAYAGFYAFGDTASAFRVRNVTLENLLVVGGEYGVATHNNGDLATFNNVRVFGVGARAYFAYGVDRHQGAIQADGVSNNTFGLFMIKAYDRDTSNLNLRLRSNCSSNGGVPKLFFQSQHAPAVQATPKRIINARIDFSDIGTSGSSIEFDYYRDAVQTATSADNLFDNIVLSGHTVSPATSTVVQGNSARGYLDISDLVAVSGASTLLRNSGFYGDRLLTWTPALAFGGSSTGITYSAQSGEYYTKGNVVFCTVRLTLTSKGAQTGAASISLPIPSANYSSTGMGVHGVAVAGFSGLTSPLIGFVDNNGTKLNLQHQGAAAASNLTDANFTNTSDLMLTFWYTT